jgi:hypothetical protein
MDDKLGVLSHECLAGGSKIKLLGVIAEKLPVHPRPDKPSVGVDIDLGHPQPGGRQAFLPKRRKLSGIGDGEKLADDVRQKWNLGIDPIPNMTELLEEKGLKVLTVPLPNRVSGLTCVVKRPGEQPELPVIVVSNQLSLARRRLTLANELAHRLIDTDSLSDRDEEKAATVFAGAFLIPREHLLREAGKCRNALGYTELNRQESGARRNAPAASSGCVTAPLQRG